MLECIEGSARFIQCIQKRSIKRCDKHVQLTVCVPHTPVVGQEGHPRVQHHIARLWPVTPRSVYPRLLDQLRLVDGLRPARVRVAARVMHLIEESHICSSRKLRFIISHGKVTPKPAPLSLAQLSPTVKGVPERETGHLPASVPYI